MNVKKEKIVLAYSGGLDTSVAIRWLQQQYNYDVIAVYVDVGENKDIQHIQQKALKVGAIQSHVVDAKEKFAKDFLLPALRANALYENIYPLISALSRPLIAQQLVEIAIQQNATAIAHGCTGKGNDQVRFDVAFKTLAPHLKIVAPQREAPMAREAAIEYAAQHDIPLPINRDNPFSIDQNLWGRSCECGVLEDPWCEAPEAAFAWTNSLENAPQQADEIIIHFEKGMPIALNEEKLSFVEIINLLNDLAGKHGVGRIDHVENRLVGIKSREVYEAPAAMTLINAHKALETLTLTRDVMHFKPLIEQAFAKLIYEGLWFSPLKQALLSFIETTQQVVTGSVRLKLCKGNIWITGRQSVHSLYSNELATYQAHDEFDHQAAEGFIKLWGLPSQLFAAINENKERIFTSSLVSTAD